jgi:hypothetical protein
MGDKFFLRKDFKEKRKDPEGDLGFQQYVLFL